MEYFNQFIPDHAPWPVTIIALTILLVLLLERIYFFVVPKPKHSLSLRKLGYALAGIMALFWSALLLVLLFGLSGLILELLAAFPPPPGEDRTWYLTLAKLVTLTGVLGAVIALPFTVIRTVLNRRQTEAAEASLLNDKVNAAVDDLHAQRQVTRWTEDKAENGWEDDITRRNGAIDRLRGLVEEEPGLQPRVDRLLTVYLQQLTRLYPAAEPDEDATPDELRVWAHGLEMKRSDMENAVLSLSRLRRPEKTTSLPDLAEVNMQKMRLEGIDLQGADLRWAKLQGADLSWAKLQGADLSWAQLQGAHLFEAKLQGADLTGAKLQGADLSGAKVNGANLLGARLQGADLCEAKLQGANLSWAKLQGADLSGAELQGADLSGAEFDGDTFLTAALLRGAAVRSVDFSSVAQIRDHLGTLFGDATVIFPKDMDVPKRFDDSYDSYDEFHTAWRAFQRSIGQDPDNPT